MEKHNQSPQSLPDSLYALCGSIDYSGELPEWGHNCCRVMGEYGATVFNGLDKASPSAVLVGIFAGFVKELYHTDSYEALVERLTEGYGEVMGWLEYIAKHAWASGPADLPPVAGQKARSVHGKLRSCSPVCNPVSWPKSR
jgi:hypothetical protein